MIKETLFWVATVHFTTEDIFLITSTGPSECFIQRLTYICTLEYFCIKSTDLF